MIELLSRVSSPREREKTLVGVSARGDVLGDEDGPFVVDVGARLGVLPNDVPGLAGVIRE